MSKIKKHNRDCDCKDGETFVCECCGEEIGWCLGASDNASELCDKCWAEAEKGE